MKRIITMTLVSVFVLGLTSMNVNAQDKKASDAIIKIKERIDPASISGLHTYDASAMLKVMKIRKAVKKSTVSNLFSEYNSSLSELKDENIGLLVGLGVSVKDVIKEKDFKALWKSRADYKAQVKLVQDAYLGIHSSLDSELAEVLTNRQKRKWAKHQEALRKQDDATFDMGDLFSYVGL